ncbi:hypothetical protein BB560_003020 [Smittium megazygosporum]|uniref:Arginine biosynthesis bifunctional protein ArgJ, mitochondrial n=1 Tax=Smittium megazygosporum TaxID=133381 RepID=A0A2T9ZD58_9FUNG|nr:hypothetical protein BB560_003020 [Smittium megazygosporum]
MLLFKSLAQKATASRSLFLNSSFSIRNSSTMFPENKLRFIPTSGTYPLGFFAGSLCCGIKKTLRNDLTFIYSSTPCTASAAFTKNLVKAAPVTFDKSLLDNVKASGTPTIRAVVVNSGVANAVTGIVGMANCEKMANAADKLMELCDKDSKNPIVSSSSSSLNKTLVMSTGVIGQQLPIEKIVSGISNLQGKLGSDHEHWFQAALGFMTTDTFPKIITKRLQLPSGKGSFNLCGIAKGAGMIHPNMATLLSSVFTDASISQAALDNALSYAVDLSFNSITVDGDTSTNDTITVLANGQASTSTGNKWEIQLENDPDFDFFKTSLAEFLKELAILVVRDGEGATKFIEINVTNAGSTEDAKKIAKSIANSPLVKTAFYGQDANWGRILCATGYSYPSSFNPDTVCLYLVPKDGSPQLPLLVNGQPIPFDEARASEILKPEDISILIDLGISKHSATVYTCDLSHEYVNINGSYRS